ncbi:hypothetical protein FNV43_RR25635 [Rhamnella rubrinervis]|uniref:DCD domain-containing protein n=1 Tax=Rhamnella rubrinervis TaxID=2594499 RepID=A0A8K0DNA1_9ROSA|nr:hypothetical protein FNV43_RR25635 [Rhamnella rubrinervis]
MEKRRNKKLVDSGSSINHIDKSLKIRKRFKSKRNKKPMEISAYAMSDPGPSSLAVADNTNVTVGISSTCHNLSLRNIINQGKNKEMDSEQSNSGFIFMCNGKTKPECYQYRVFGLPRGNVDVVKAIKPGTRLFLYDFDLKLLYGTYEATSNGGLDLEPSAFQGKFPAQVKFRIMKDSLPLREREFKVAIKDNYQGGSKFRQVLSSNQVKALVSLFRPISVPVPSYAGASLSNVPRPHSFPSPITEEGFQPPTRLPHPGDYCQYGLEAHVAQRQPPMDPRHVVQHAALPHNVDSYYLIEAQKPYLHEKPFLSLEDPYRRYLGSSVPKDQVVEYGREHQTSQLPIGSESEDVPHSDHVAEYYSQRFPSAAASYVSIQSHPLPSAHPQPFHAHPQGELQSSHENYYSEHVPTAAASHVSVQSHSLSSSHPQPFPVHPQGELQTSHEAYHSQHFPSAAASHVSIQSHPLPSPHPQPIPAHPQGELQSFHEPYYPVPIHGNLSHVYAVPVQRPLLGSSEATTQVTSHFSFAGAAPSYH